MPRPARLSPREIVGAWPGGPSADPVGKIARLFALNLRRAIADRSLRAAAAPTSVDHSTIMAILEGRS